MRGKYTVYIHHDGYPSGAASYFYSMALLDKGGLVERFIRANDGASLTPSHDAHGDTEYQYTVNGCDLNAILTGYRVKDGMCIFSGPLWEFINEHGKTISEWTNGNFSPLRTLRIGQSSNDVVLNESLAIAYIEQDYGYMRRLRMWKEKGNGSSWYVKETIDNLRQVVEVFPSLMTDEIASFIGGVPSGANS
jgi:hypothetical protein